MQSENQKQNPSTLDQVIDVIVDTGLKNPDYGKDIGDR